MTLEQLEKEARKRTEDLIGAWPSSPGAKYIPKGQTKKLLSAYQTAFSEIDEKLKAIHVKFLSGVKPEDYYNEILKYNRFETLRNQIAQAYVEAARKAGVAQVEISKTAISNLYYHNMYAVNWFSGLDNKEYFVVLNPKIIEVSVFGTPKAWEGITKSARARLLPYQPQHGTLTATLLSNKDKDLIKINQTITQALIQGKSYTKTSQEIKSILNTTANNAVRIARTEGARNMNAGAYSNSLDAIKAGVDLKRRYLATLDTRTRPQSGSMDGQEVAPDKPFVYPNGARAFIVGNSGVAKYDINDRCTSIDVLEESPPTLRRGRNPVTGKNEVTSYKDFNQWMDDKKLKYNDAGRMVSK